MTDDSATRLNNEFATNDPSVVFSYIPLKDDDTKRPVEICSLEMFLLQNVNANDKLIIIADTRHTQRWSERKIDPTLCQRDLAFFCNCPVTLEKLRLWAHERSPGIPRDVGDLETIEFADVLGATAENQHLTRVSQVQKSTRLNSVIRERLTKFSEIKTWKKEEMPWKKLTEKLICLNRCLFLVTQSPRKNAWHPGFAFLAELALQSGGYIETCDIDERSTRADVTCCPSSTRLYQCRKHFSMSEMRQRKAETSNTQSVTTSTLYVQSRSGS